MSKFKQLNQNFDLVSLEKETLDRWESEKIFEQVKKKYISNDPWIYYDGPITANGRPHYGHAITWTMKDVLPRYWTMQQKFVSRNIGWDCQGILVEYEVEKALGFESKDDIQKYGIDKFNQACRDSVLHHRTAMLEFETRLGRWVDHDDEYSTMDPDYIESMWWGISELMRKGFLYKGHKVVAYSTRAGMTLSAHEVADGGYKEIVDPAVTVKFKLESQNQYLLAWTTTPWTLPGNLLIAVGKNIEYCEVEYDGEKYILALDLVGKVFEGKSYVVKGKISANELVGQKYIPLFKNFSDRSEKGAFQVVYGDHVTTETGTGLVHLAPYGEEDFVILLNRKIPMFDYLDESGHFNDLVPQYTGQFYKKANQSIIEDLQKSNQLFKHEEYAHQMPMCYRTKTPLIYKPIESYYVNIEKLKPKLLEEVKKVKFVPELGGKRFTDWIENARDWSLSRRRYWGTPLPIWVNEKTGEEVVVGSFAELEKLSGKKLPENFDPHKPFVDEIIWGDEATGVYRRVPEVIDVWFDSGSMTYARHHYPFENQEKLKSTYPAEYISEGDDQLRLWFYTMFVLGVALFDSTPFLNVIVIGMLGDEKGKKMSKSSGNYPPIEEVFNDWGADMLRYFLLKSGVAKAEATAFSYKALEETKKEFFTMLWNSYRYFLTYAEVNNFEPTDNSSSDILDKWILDQLNQLVISMNNKFKDYEVMLATRELAPFVNNLSTWYIRRSRDRISSGDKDALQTLYFVLLTLSKLMAPIMPLLSDYLYLAITNGANEKSVHLEKYPEAICDMNLSPQVVEDMEFARRISSIGNSIRKLNNLPVRQPLSELYVSGTKSLSSDFESIIKDELNIKTIKYGEPSDKSGLLSETEADLTIWIDSRLNEELEIEGLVREITREIQKLRKDTGVAWDAKICVEYPQEEKLQKAVDKFGNEIKKKTLVEELRPGKGYRVIS